MKRNRLSVYPKESNENASSEGETEAANVHKTADLDCQICHAESLKTENALTKNDNTGRDVQSDQDLPLRADRDCNTSNMPDANFSNFGPKCLKMYLKKADIDLEALCGEMNANQTLEKSEHFIPNFDEGIMTRNSLPVCPKDSNGNTSSESETADLDCQICHAESLKTENALTKNDRPGHDVQSDQELPLRADRDCNNTSNMSDASFTDYGPKCLKRYLKRTDIDLEALCGEMNANQTLEKSEHFIPNFDERIMKRNSLSVCPKDSNGNASSESETETAIVHKTADLDCQICHAESLKAESALTKNDRTGHDAQSDQDLPFRADGDGNNTSNMSDANFSDYGPNCLKMYLKRTDIDLEALYGEMNEFFPSLSNAGRVSHPDSEQTTVQQRPIFEAGPSSYSSYPSTSGFQPNGDHGTKGASKQLANRSE